MLEVKAIIGIQIFEENFLLLESIYCILCKDHARLFTKSGVLRMYCPDCHCNAVRRWILCLFYLNPILLLSLDIVSIYWHSGLEIKYLIIKCQTIIIFWEVLSDGQNTEVKGRATEFDSHRVITSHS